MQFFARKSPKATKAKETATKKEENQNKESKTLTTNNRGAFGPPLGDWNDPEGHSSVDPVAGSSPVATGGGSEESGSSARKVGRKKKRDLMSLGKGPIALPDRRRTLEGNAKIAELEGTPRKRYKDIRNWFEARGKPPGNSE